MWDLREKGRLRLGTSESPTTFLPEIPGQSRDPILGYSHPFGPFVHYSTHLSVSRLRPQLSVPIGESPGPSPTLGQSKRPLQGLSNTVVNVDLRQASN